MGLQTYIIRRLILLFPILMGVALLVFAVNQMLPVEQRVAVFAPEPRDLRNRPTIIAEYGLDQPIYIQFSRWLSGVLPIRYSPSTLSFSISQQNYQIPWFNLGLKDPNLGWAESVGQPVWSAMIERLPATVEIVIFTTPMIIFVGIALGMASASHKDKAIDHASRIFSISGSSLPSFWWGIVLLALLSAGLKWFPPGGRFDPQLQIKYFGTSSWYQYTGLLVVDAILNWQSVVLVDAIMHLILPAVVLATIQTSVIVRVMRSSMLEALSKGYITAARAKGLSRKEVFNKHARRNALIPVVTISGLLVAGMLTGVTITETVFNFPGVGRFAADAARALDVSAVLGYALLSGVVFVIANLIVDIAYAYIDPRIRLG